MNYVQLYENQRKKPLKIGSKWEWKLNWYTNTIVEIIDVRDDGLVSYRYILDGFRHQRSKKEFLNIFKPYNETSTHHELL